MGQTCSTCNCNKDEKDFEFEVKNNTSAKKHGAHKSAPGMQDTSQLYMEDNEHIRAQEEMGYAEDTIESGDENGQIEYRDEFKFKNGAVYKGQWKGQMRHGQGEQIWPDGARY